MGKTKSKRLLCLLLSLAMVFTLISVPVYAEEVEAVESNAEEEIALMSSSEEQTEDSAASVTIDGTTLYYDSVSEALSAITDEATLVILQECDTDIAVASGQTITLDLQTDYHGDITIASGGELIFSSTYDMMGGSVAVEGILTVEKSEVGSTTLNDGAVMTIYGGGAQGVSVSEGAALTVSGGGVSSVYGLTINGGTVEISSGSASDVTISGGLLTISGGTVREVLTVTGGEVEITGGTVAADTVFTVAGGTVAISGGTVRAAVEVSDGDLTVSDDASLTGGITLSGSGTVEITGGSVTMNGDGAEVTITVTEDATGSLTISGGTIDNNSEFNSDNTLFSIADDTGATVTITGGTFTGEVESYIDTDSYSVTENEDGTYTVSENVTTVYVAKVTDSEGNEESYETLAEAVAAAESGDTITLLQDVTEASSVTIAEDQSVVLNLNGYTLTFSSGTTTSIASGNASVTAGLINNGTLEIKGGTVKKSGGSVILNTGTLTIDDDAEISGSTAITNDSGTVNTSGTLNGTSNTIQTFGGIVNITGGSVTTTSNSGDYAIAIFNSAYDSADETAVGANVTISGGTVSGASPIGTNDIRSGDSSLTITGGTIMGSYAAIYWPSSGTLTIGTDGSTDNTTPVLTSDYGSTIVICCGTLNVYSGTIEATITSDTWSSLGLTAPLSSYSYANYLRNSSGILGLGDAISIYANRSSSYAQYDLTVNITGGELTSASGYAVRYIDSNEYSDTDTTDTEQTVSVSLSGGTYTGGTGADGTAIDAVDASCVSDEDKAIISGGTYSSDVSEYCVDGALATATTDDDGNTVYTIASYNFTVTKTDGTVTGYDTLRNAVTAASESTGSTVKLFIDATPSSYVEVSGTITIDLNGHTISCSATSSSYGVLYVTGSLTLIDSAGGGEVINTSTSTYGNAIRLAASASFIMEGGKVTGKYGIYGSQYSTVTITGGTVTATGTYAVQTLGGTIEITGTDRVEITSTSTSSSARGIYMQTNDGSVLKIDNPNTYISAKTAIAHSTSKTYTAYVSAGYYSTDVTNYVTDGYECVANDDDTYKYTVKEGVTAETAEAYVTDATGAVLNYYVTLEKAIQAAEDGQIVVLKESTSGNGINLDTSEKSITIDLGGNIYTITSAVGSTGTATNGLRFTEGGSVTIKNGTIRAGINNIGILIQNYCDLTLENVQLPRYTNSCDYALSCNAGSTVLTGNTVIGSDAASASKYIAIDIYYWPSNSYAEGVSVTIDENFTGSITGIIRYSSDGTESGIADVADKAKLTIKAGEFYGSFVTANLNGNGDTGIEISGGHFATDLADTPTYIAEGYEAYTETEGTYVEAGIPYTVKEAENVASVTTTDDEGTETVTKYTALDAALAAAVDGDTVTLLKDINVESNLTASVDGSVTLDLAGCDLTINSGITLTVDAGTTVTIVDSASAGLVTNNGIISVSGTLDIRDLAYTTDADNGYGLLGQTSGKTVMASTGVFIVPDAWNGMWYSSAWDPNWTSATGTYTYNDITYTGIFSSLAVGAKVYSFGVGYECTTAFEQSSYDSNTTYWELSGTYLVEYFKTSRGGNDIDVADSSTWTYPTVDSDTIFAGWYDVDETSTVYDATSGEAYAKFVNLKYSSKNGGGIIRYLGGSLRMDYKDENGDPDYSQTSLRFGYDIVVPTDCDTTYSWYWEYTLDGYSTVYNVEGTEKGTATAQSAAIGNTIFRSNLVITGIPAKYYDMDITSTLYVTYATGDGTTVIAVRPTSQITNVETIAGYMQSGGTEDEKTYAAGILAAMTEETVEASTEEETEESNE